MSTTRHTQVLAAVNGIVDPCSAAVGVPIGIADMGLVERLELDGNRVELVLLPTSPHCMYVGHFEEEIESRVGALPWVEFVQVTLSDCTTIWDDSRMTDAARSELYETHRRPRGRLLDVIAS